MKNYHPVITPQMLGLISEIEEFKGRWEALNTLSYDRLKQLKKSATIESIASSTRIEGVQLSDQEVESFLNQINTVSFRSRDEEEVAGYAEAMDLIFESYNELKISENHIKHLHALLLKYSSKDIRHRGQYKGIENNIVAFDARGLEIGIVFKTSSPFETPFKMTELIEWTCKALEEKQLHCLLVISIFTDVFLAIHPFQDGNGRLSRILTNLLLLKQGYHYIQYSSLESIIEENKEAYDKNLRRCQVTLNNEKIAFEGWVIFFLKCLKKQKDQLEIKVRTEKILQENFDNYHLRILAIVKKHQPLAISEIQHLSGINRPTLKVKLADLVKLKKLVKIGRGRGVVYELKNKNFL